LLRYPLKQCLMNLHQSVLMLIVTHVRQPDARPMRPFRLAQQIVRSMVYYRPTFSNLSLSARPASSGLEVARLHSQYHRNNSSRQRQPWRQPPRPSLWPRAPLASVPPPMSWSAIATHECPPPLPSPLSTMRKPSGAALAASYS
jgi:hypothetical protein